MLLAVLVVSCGTPAEQPPAAPSRPGSAAQSPDAVPTRAPTRLAPRFESYTVADGLVASEVNAILQDRQGFLWIGTWNGLSRFDGASFVSFLHDPADPASLSDNLVHTLYEDRDHILWVGTEGGLGRFDPATQTFTSYRHAPADAASLSHDNVRAIVEGEPGTLWIGTWGGGLNRFDTAAGLFTRIQAPPGAEQQRDDVHALLANPDGTLWLGGSDGLTLYDPARGTAAVIRIDPRDPASAALPPLVSLARDPSGAIWSGSVRAGVFRYDPATQTMAAYPNSPDTPGAIGNPWVLSLLVDRAGAVWAGTNGAGLHRYDPATDTFDRFRFDPSDPQSLRDDRVLALYEDRSGVLWCGTYEGLARRHPLSRHVAREAMRPDDSQSLSSNAVTSFAEEADGTLWVGTHGGGLNRRLAPEAGFSRVALGPARSQTATTEHILSLVLDDEGTLWVGTADGLFRRERSTGVFSAVPEAERYKNGRLAVLYSLSAADGHVIASSGRGGVLDIETRSGRVTHAAAHPGTYAVSALRSRTGTLWSGTIRAGLWRAAADPDSGLVLRPVPLGLRSEKVTALYEGREDALWIGTSDGLYRLAGTGAATTLALFHRADGLPNTAIGDIAEDRRGRLWVITGAGLSWYDDRSGAFLSYGTADGQGAAGTLYKSPHTGRFYVGGNLGYSTLDPAALDAESPPPAPTLTGLRVLGEPVRAGAEGSPLRRPLWQTKALRLRYTDRVVTFEFAALDFRAPQTHRYSVRLDGFDAGWREVGAQREATFTNLGPGRYTLRVRAAGRDGVWSEPAALALTVLPPWWRTGWAYGLGALGALALVYLLDRTRRTREGLRHRAEIGQIEAEQLRALDRSKSRFFANVSHEFRTPLTLTIGPLDDVLAGEYGPVPAEAREPLGLARRSAERVLTLINQILDVARLEGGSAPFCARPLDLAAFAEAQVEAFRPLAAHRRIDIEIVAPKAVSSGQAPTAAGSDQAPKAVLSDQAPDAPVLVWADPEHAGTILANVLSNAFKFTPEGGSVQVETELDAETARVTVRDSGPGIAAADLARVFDRFYQAAGSAGRPLGSGIGLALAHELAALHGGTLTAESVVAGPGGGPSGSAFTLALPLGSAHLDPDRLDRRPWDAATDAAAAVHPDADFRDAARLPSPPPEPDGNEPGDDEPDDDGADDDVTTILVADDHPDIRAYVRRHLEAAGYRVIEAADGEDALASVRRRLPDLVVSDVMMPRLDGLGLCRAIRADPETDFVPVLLLTAKAALEDRLGGLTEACDDYLTKPFDVRELVARVQNLIASRRRLRERFAAAAGPSGDEAAGDEAAGDEAAGDGAVSLPPIVSADDAFAEAVRAAIEAHLGDETFDVGALASAVGQSRSHLLRRTNALLGASPSALIRTARLDRAAALLTARAGTVSEIAYAVGFKSVAHFSNAFLAHTGHRPSAFAETSR